MIVRDHPRSRGVYGGVYPGTRFRVGSSPLARGLRPHESGRRAGRGIIPARAGFTRQAFQGARLGRDHPRSRGVYINMLSARHPFVGSSPLARGLPMPGVGDVPVVGIIPARAGFTRGCFRLFRDRRDHPRSRGVYAKLYLNSLYGKGSSPLARGLHEHIDALQADFRIIPARAGFTLADPWNPNDEPHYQTSFAFTADLALAPQSSDSVVVSQRSTRTPSEA